MKKRIIPTKANKIAIERALKEHRALKKTKEVLKNYKGNSKKLLQIKNLCNTYFKK